MDRIPPEILSILIGLLATVLTGFISWFTKVGVDWLTEKISKSQNEKVNAELQKFLNIASEAVNTAVSAIMQSYVDKIKDTDQWTEETQAVATDMAIVTAQDQMGPAAVAAIKAFIGADGPEAVEAWLRPRVLAEIEKVKLLIAERKRAESQNKAMVPCK